MPVHCDKLSPEEARIRRKAALQRYYIKHKENENKRSLEWQNIQYKINESFREKRKALSREYNRNPENRDTINGRNRKYYQINKNDVEYMDRQRRNQREWNLRIKIKAFLRIGHGQITCINCGCDMVEILQINHKNGGGNKERQNSKISATEIYRRIANGRRDIEDLELRCYPCNALHYVEMKYGHLPIEIKWKKEGT